MNAEVTLNTGFPVADMHNHHPLSEASRSRCLRTVEMIAYKTFIALLAAGCYILPTAAASIEFNTEREAYTTTCSNWKWNLQTKADNPSIISAGILGFSIGILSDVCFSNKPFLARTWNNLSLIVMPHSLIKGVGTLTCLSSTINMSQCQMGASVLTNYTSPLFCMGYAIIRKCSMRN